MFPWLFFNCLLRNWIRSWGLAMTQTTQVILYMIYGYWLPKNDWPQNGWNMLKYYRWWSLCSLWYPNWASNHRLYYGMLQNMLKQVHTHKYQESREIKIAYDSLMSFPGSSKKLPFRIQGHCLFIKSISAFLWRFGYWSNDRPFLSSEAPLGNMVATSGTH